jgi:hypothetical protein
MELAGLEPATSSVRSGAAPGCLKPRFGSRPGLPAATAFHPDLAGYLRIVPLILPCRRGSVLGYLWRKVATSERRLEVVAGLLPLGIFIH